MADERATGVILRTRPLTETSLIVSWLAPGLGRLATVAKGARRPKSPFRGKLDLFHTCDFSFARSRRSDLHTLREVELLNAPVRLRENYPLLQQACYAAALIEQTTEVETPLDEIVDLFLGFLAHVGGERPARSRTVLAFELRLLEELGLAPDFSTPRLSVLAPLAGALIHTPWPELDGLEASPDDARALRQFLHGFLIFQFNRLAGGRSAAVGGRETD